MTAAVQLIDATPAGEQLRTFTLHLVSEQVTARDLIETRVRQEVAAYNRRQGTTFCGLVQPVATERVLNGFKVRRGHTLNADKQCAAAVAAFEANGFFLLVDDRQVESLDERIPLTDQTTVSFVKLVPLVGG